MKGKSFSQLHPFFKDFSTVSISTLAVAACLSLAQVDANVPPSTRKDFEEYCHAWQGRWVGDITWVADWPGLGNRGEKATGHIDYRIVENGNALLGTFYAGSGSATVLTVFDEASKQTQERFVISNGYVSNGIVYKQDGKWRFRDAGGLPDGTKSTAVGTLTISDDGNTHTLTSTGTKGDKPTDPQNDVWRRVSKK